MARVRVNEEGVAGDGDPRRVGVRDGERVRLVSGEAVDFGSGRLQPAEDVVEGAVFHDQNDDRFDGSLDFGGFACPSSVNGLGRY